MLRRLWCWLKGNGANYETKRQDALQAIRSHKQASENLKETLDEMNGHIPPRPPLKSATPDDAEERDRDGER